MIYLVVEVARIVGVGMAQAFLLRCRWLEHGRQDACGTFWREQIIRYRGAGIRNSVGVKRFVSGDKRIHIAAP